MDEQSVEVSGGRRLRSLRGAAQVRCAARGGARLCGVTRVGEYGAGTSRVRCAVTGPGGRRSGSLKERGTKWVRGGVRDSRAARPGAAGRHRGC